MALARPNARMHRLTGAQLLPSRQGHGIVAFARICPSSGTPSSSVVQYCMVFIWLVTGVARLAGVRFHCFALLHVADGPRHAFARRSFRFLGALLRSLGMGSALRCS